jgi:hypothetical protein
MCIDDNLNNENSPEPEESQEAKSVKENTGNGVCDDSTELAAYKIKVQSNADNRIYDELSNSGADHAKIIMSNILRTSKEHVRIFAGDLNGEVSNDPEYLMWLETLIFSGKKLHIKLEREPNRATSKAFQKILELKKRFSKNITIEIVGDKNLDRLKLDDKVFHFTIGDDRMFRFETDINKYVAIANFNDKETAKLLIDKFNSLKIERQIAA